MKKRSSRDLRGKRAVKGWRERWFALLMVLCIIAITLLYSRWFFSNKGGESSSSSSVDMSKAAIVDGIGLTRPNPSFINGVRGILEKAGLSVDIYSGENVTIDLLRRIGGYGLLILRLHSAIDPKYGFLYLFSAERFNETEYETRFSEERTSGAVREGVTFEGERYFTLRADLLGYMCEGGLNGSTIILMGCNGTDSDHAISRLFDKGVKAIIAWDGYVDLSYTDKVTLKLIEMVYAEDLSFEEAVNKIMNGTDGYGPDPTYKSKLEYLTKPS